MAASDFTVEKNVAGICAELQDVVSALITIKKLCVLGQGDPEARADYLVAIEALSAQSGAIVDGIIGDNAVGDFRKWRKLGYAPDAAAGDQP